MTSDANGNLATDNGSTFARLNRSEGRLDEQEAGIALAIATEGPDLTGNESFGISLSYGNFEGSSAIGGGVTGVVSRNFLRQGTRLALTGGLGVGFVDGDNGFNGGTSRGGDDGEDAVVGGRVGAQLTW